MTIANDGSADKPLANIGIAVTRPLKQATKLSKMIQDAGGNVITFPLIDIVPLDDYSEFESVITHIAEYDWIIFISSNAVQNGMPRLIKQGIPAKLKFAAIGPVTAQTLSNLGANQVLIPKDRFDSESLLSLPEMHAMQGKKVMIVRGIGGREVLADTLKSRGASVTFAECYQRINPQHDCKILDQQWHANKLHGIVITSSEAMRHYIALASDKNWVKQLPVFVNHARIAEDSTSQNLQIHIAQTAGDPAMMNNIMTTLLQVQQK